MALRVRVCQVDEILEGVLKSFPVEGVEVPVLVTRVEGEIIAGTSMCPHEDVSLVRGSIQQGEIVCRAHGYAFDLKTGQCAHDPKLRWRVYRTQIVGDDLYVQLL
jgi:nitrite reductase/ring-hydroxylating ferredoxin subunit